jgi:asparagine N-glycosylation enzyme membrane subunit Stt3
LTSDCCTTCGSRLLSTGIKCINLRPFSWLVVIGGISLALILLIPIAFASIGSSLRSLYSQVLMFIFGPVLTLIIFRIILSPLLGEKGSKMFDEVWSSCLKVVVSVLMLPVRVLEHQFKKKKKKD